MTVEQAARDRVVNSVEIPELDWDAVYADQARRVYNYFRFRMGTGADIPDLTSRTFEKAWRSRGKYRRDLGGFSTWLFTIAKNIGRDYVKSRRSLLPIEAALNVPAGETPEEDAERGSNLARLTALTRELPERERELIALKYGADLNNRLIAGITGLSESNVGTILHRAVQSLRARW
jgi:RNA polymerase sigma-70 factor (ECF subfamily)